MRFRDRSDAGRRLAEEMVDTVYADPVVVGIAPGGVPVAAVVAQRLRLPLTVVDLRPPDRRRLAPPAGAPPLRGRTAIVVDDGVATGDTLTRACDEIRAQGPACVVAAVPVAPVETIATLRRHADEIVCLYEPWRFHSLDAYYDEFPEPADHELERLLSARPSEGATG